VAAERIYGRALALAGKFDYIRMMLHI
jgi:hypothetical protein